MEENGVLPPYAGGTDNTPFVHQINHNHTLDEDPDLADLDGVDYDAIVVKDARIVHLTEVRLEGHTLVPLKRDENIEAGTSQL